MLKKVFIASVIVTILFSCQIESGELAKSDEKKSEERIIANSPASLTEFLLKSFKELKTYAEAFPYPKKGEFETTQEYETRVADWKKRGGQDNIYKATGLFPIKLNEYNADTEMFDSVKLEFVPTSKEYMYSGYFRGIEVEVASEWNKSVDIHIFSKIEGDQSRFPPTGKVVFEGVGYYQKFDGYSAGLVKCSREKARIFRAETNKLRCDIVFKLSYTPGYPPGGGSYRHLFEIRLYGIKFYSLETGEILYQASVEK